MSCRHCNGQGSGCSAHSGSALRSLYRSPHEVGNGGRSDPSNWGRYCRPLLIVPFWGAVQAASLVQDWQVRFPGRELKIKDQLWDIWLGGSRSMMRTSSPHTHSPIRYGNQGNTVDSGYGRFGLSIDSTYFIGLALNIYSAFCVASA